MLNLLLWGYLGWRQHMAKRKNIQIWKQNTSKQWAGGLLSASAGVESSSHALNCQLNSCRKRSGTTEQVLMQLRLPSLSQRLQDVLYVPAPAGLEKVTAASDEEWLTSNLKHTNNLKRLQVHRLMQLLFFFPSFLLLDGSWFSCITSNGLYIASPFLSFLHTIRKYDSSQTNKVTKLTFSRHNFFFDIFAT